MFNLKQWKLHGVLLGAFGVVPLVPLCHATTNDDAFFDYLNTVICDAPEGDLVATCAAAGETVGGSGETLSQTGNTGTQGANELAARERLQLPGTENEDSEAVARMEFNGLGMFGGIDYRNLERSNTDAETGYDGSAWLASVGLDYRLSERLLAGGAFSWQETDLDMNTDAGKVSTESQEWVAFASYQLSPSFYLDGYLGWLQQENDTDRNVRFGLIRNTARARFDSEKTQWGLGAGYQMNLQALALDLALRYEGSELDIDAYEETGGDPIENLNLAYARQTVDSETLTLALFAAYSLGLQQGVLVPYFKSEITREQEDDARTVQTHLVVAPDAPAFTIITDAPDDLYGVVGAGVQMIVPGGLMFYLDAESLVSHEYLDSWKISSGIRMEL
ncbi:MAG: autotransporter outer membrane beta-barrel domain-containing protein [Pseudomonadota bacterium]|nr:autotransporter outer membrane beta-barrel domain-containing protein [Pseudomonadota bacterium]